MRVVIDTNIWIHYLIQGSIPNIDNAIKKEGLEVLLSQELLDEFMVVALRPKFSKYFERQDIYELHFLLESTFQLIEVTTSVVVCRDPKDNFLLALCNDGKADYLITGDDDLLELNSYQATTIITLKDFLKLLH